MSDSIRSWRRCARLVRQLASSPAQIALLSLAPAIVLAAPAAAQQAAPLTLRDAIARGATRSELEQLAACSAWHPMLHDGWAKVAAGLTTVEEVLRVIAA